METCRNQTQNKASSGWRLSGAGRVLHLRHLCRRVSGQRSGRLGP